MDKIIYIGAGAHIEPIDEFPSTKEFVFVDIKPRCDNDVPYFSRKSYDRNFCRILIDKLVDRNFKLTQSVLLDEYWKTVLTCKQKICYLINNISELINPTLLIFTNDITGQKVKYYISTSILYNMCLTLKTDITTSDVFIFEASSTHQEILNYFDEPKICITYLDNNHDTDKYNENTLIYFLNNNTCSIFYYFREFYLLETSPRKINQIKAYETFSDLKDALEIKRKENALHNFCKIDINLCNFV